MRAAAVVSDRSTGTSGEMVTRDELIRSATLQFQAVNVPNARGDARWLFLAAAHVSHAEFIASPHAPVPDCVVDRFEALVARRLSREPVSRILGRRAFGDCELSISPHVLDPRPDTEIIVDVVRHVSRHGAISNGARIADIGTGSGALLVSLLALLPHATAVGTDLSRDALRVAKKNAAEQGCDNRSVFVQTHWLDGCIGPFDLIVSNPPYIRSGDIATLSPEVRDHDPLLALDGGADGLDAYRAIAERIGDALADDGLLLLEVGRGQADDVIELFCAPGLLPVATSVRMLSDLAGVHRVVALSRPEVGARYGKHLE